MSETPSIWPSRLMTSLTAAVTSGLSALMSPLPWISTRSPISSGKVGVVDDDVVALGLAVAHLRRLEILLADLTADDGREHYEQDPADDGRLPVRRTPPAGARREVAGLHLGSSSREFVREVLLGDMRRLPGTRPAAYECSQASRACGSPEPWCGQPLRAVRNPRASPPRRSRPAARRRQAHDRQLLARARDGEELGARGRLRGRRVRGQPADGQLAVEHRDGDGRSLACAHRRVSPWPVRS